MNYYLAGLGKQDGPVLLGSVKPLGLGTAPVRLLGAGAAAGTRSSSTETCPRREGHCTSVSLFLTPAQGHGSVAPLAVLFQASWEIIPFTRV